MPDLKTKVSVTSSTAENISRHDMLEWVNSTVNGQYKKIEELCSGIAYCQIMEVLFPNSVCLRKIKYNAKLEHEFLHNLKLFQAAFTKLNFDKSVPIDRLVKGKFQDNFEFLQWFKKFFDTHSPGKENLKVPATVTQNSQKPARKSGAQTLPCKGSGAKAQKNKQEERSVSPSSLHVLQETIAQLAELMTQVEMERNIYYKKLAKIETILNESIKNKAHAEWCTRAVNILYAIDDSAPFGNEETGGGEE